MKIKDNCLYYTISTNTSIDEILNFWHLGKKTKYKLYQEGKIKVNNKTRKQSCLLSTGDILIIDVELTSIRLTKNCPIKVLYEDAILLVVNKPRGILVHSDGSLNLDVQMILQLYYPHPIKESLQAIHRLDIDTSGILLFSKNSFFQPKLDFMIQNNEIQRSYLAIVEGVLTHSLTIHSNLAKDRHSANKMRVSKQGKSAITHVDVLSTEPNLSLIRCRLETGRTHQIRVHLASIQHPLLGDVLYNPKEHKHPMCLHSYEVSFIHPLRNRQIKLLCKPKDWKSIFDLTAIK